MEGSSQLPKKFAFPPCVLIALPQICWFCNFHAVFYHYPQIASSQQVDPIWETLGSVLGLITVTISKGDRWKRDDKVLMVFILHKIIHSIQSKKNLRTC